MIPGCFAMCCNGFCFLPVYLSLNPSFYWLHGHKRFQEVLSETINTSLLHYQKVPCFSCCILFWLHSGSKRGGFVDQVYILKPEIWELKSEDNLIFFFL